MQRIKEFLILNCSEILYILSLYIVFLILALTIGKYSGNLLLDFGREAIFPEQILQGKVLYKDIFNIFGPLSYQINAILYSIFGIHLNTLRFAGVMNSVLIIGVLYTLARFFTSKEVSWVTVFFIIIVCIFSRSPHNYIFPYTYSMIYAMSAFLFSVLFLFLYLKTSKKFFIPLSWFFAGISIASKYEYVFYVIFLFLLTILVFKPDKKNLFLSLFSFLSVPFISFSILFLQGLSWSEFFNQILLVKKFAQSPALIYFYKHSTGIYPQGPILLRILVSFFNTFLIGTLFTGLFYLIFRNKYDRFIKLFLFSLLILFEVLLFLKYINVEAIFIWLPLFIAALMIFFFLKINQEEKIKEILKTKEGFYLLFLCISFFASLKSLFILYIVNYGSFAFPLVFVALNIFVVEFLPSYFNFINKKTLKKAYVLFLIGILIPFFIHNLEYFSTEKPIKTNRGTIFDKYIINSSQQVINYIEKNLKPTDTFWVIPDGIMFNFLTNHPSNGIYYSFAEPYVQTFNEDEVVKRLRKHPPDYIIMNNLSLEDYNNQTLCLDYGFETCRAIVSLYSHIKTYKESPESESSFVMVILRKNK